MGFMIRYPSKTSIRLNNARREAGLWRGLSAFAAS